LNLGLLARISHKFKTSELGVVLITWFSLNFLPKTGIVIIGNDKLRGGLMMVKYPAFALIVLAFFSNCFADTFTHLRDGTSFNGYVVQRKKENKTLVYIENKRRQYLDLRDYQIQPNHLGRKNKVYVFDIKDSVNLMAQTEAFEKAIVIAANQGPLFILVEIDTPGARIDLAQQLCTAIARINNCQTAAFISGDRFGGAFSAGAIIALACDKVYMRTGTSIGSTASYGRSSSEVEEIEKHYGQGAGARFHSSWMTYSAATAERNNRPILLTKAMVDENIEVIEMTEGDKFFFTDSRSKKPNQSIVGTWSEKGSLLALTAVQAVQVGIADKVVDSRDELLADLAAAEAAQVPNKTILKAIRQLERAQREIDEILSSISFLEQETVTLAEEIDEVEEEIRRLNRTGYSRNTVRTEVGFDTYWSTYSVVTVEWEEILRERDSLLDELLGVLDDLIIDYRDALSLAEKHMDLRYHAKTFQDSLNAANVSYDEVLSRFDQW
jgi:ClpP class serine protease